MKISKGKEFKELGWCAPGTVVQFENVLGAHRGHKRDDPYLILDMQEYVVTTQSGRSIMRGKVQVVNLRLGLFSNFGGSRSCKKITAEVCVA